MWGGVGLAEADGSRLEERGGRVKTIEARQVCSEGNRGSRRDQTDLGQPAPG